MDFTLPDTLRYRLQNYASAVRETRAQFQGSGRAGTSPAYAPYYERSHILLLFDALAGAGTGISPDLWQEYIRITRRFERFERDAGPAYRKELLNELVNFTQAYQAALCFAYLGEPGVNPPAQRTREREIIGILLQELKKDHDLTDAERLISSLDRNVAGIAVARMEPEPADPPAILSTVGDTVPRCNQGIP